MPNQVTLISLYGDKDPEFAAAITQWQQLVAQAVGAAFTPYAIRQVHATIIGLERQRAPLYNGNFAKHHGREVVMDLTGFLAHLRGCGHLPFTVQIGGFANRDYPFTSRQTRPHERSFSVQGNKVVVMGWPVKETLCRTSPATSATQARDNRTYPPTLDLLRRGAQDFGILHGYHRTATDVDNDLFFRIGLIDPSATSPAATMGLEVEARRFFSRQQPLVIELRLGDIYIAAYEDDRLPAASTRIWSLADPKVNGSFVAGLYT